MTSLPGFTVDIDQNPYLPAGGRDVSAVVTVTADETGDARPDAVPQGGSAEIIIVDCSGSMDYPPTKMAEARAEPRQGAPGAVPPEDNRMPRRQR